MPAWSGLYNGVYDANYAPLVNRAPHLKPVNKMLRKSRTGSRIAHALLNALIGAATGSNVTETMARIGSTASPGDPVVNGGARTIETRTLLNRNTATADVTALKKIVNDTGKPTYPVDRSGNGGGGALTKTFSPGA